MENKISIPKPCHENWNDMLPEEQGRHCLSCCKTVIDFSSWDNESILAYLQNRNGERVCGRFHATQVSTPVPPLQQETWIREVLHAPMPLLRKIAAVIVLCFGLLNAGDTHAQQSMPLGKIAPPQKQDHHIKGDVAIPQPDTVKVTDTMRRPQIMGMVMPYHPPKEKPAKKVKPAKAETVKPKTQ